MQQQEIHNFLERYFLANDCEIIENHPGYMNVQLTIDLDKELMNRPFYWHYLEKTGGVPNPMKLTFITDPNKVPDEYKRRNHSFWFTPTYIRFFNQLKTLASYIRLYEKSLRHSRQTNTIKALDRFKCKDFLSMRSKKGCFPIYRAQLNKWTNGRKFPRSPFTT